MTDYSIVIPAYNEERRLGETLLEIGDFIAQSGLDADVIVVDDGSTDGTVALAESWTDRLPLRVITSGRNFGKGHAVRIGMLAATGRRRLFTDADGSTPISELTRLSAALDLLGGEGVTLGSIAVPGANVLSPQSRLRSLAGRAGNGLIQMMVLPGIKDSQRGFKLFSAAAAEAAFEEAELDGWAFDVEVLARARHAGYRLAEVPITWEHRLASRVRATSYLTSLLEVFKIRLRVGRAQPVAPSNVPA
ncbi:MAG: glycosyltransferase family 2 protein [Acidimicrobiia bacterium]|nr:glycosyltransferase family 2 protein [Acidimicrobiia bacterium]